MIDLKNGRYNWKRLLPILILLTLVSYFSAKIGNNSSSEETLQNLVDTITSKCPITYNDFLVMDSVVFRKPNKLIYYYKDSQNNELDKNQIGTIEKAIKSKFREKLSGEKMRFFIKNKVSFEHKCYNKKDDLIFSIEMKADELK